MPTTAAEIVVAIRAVSGGCHVASLMEAIALVEQYAAVVAAEASLKAADETFAKCIAITAEGLSKPLASV